MIVSQCQSKPLYVSISMLYHEYNESRSMRNEIRIDLFYCRKEGLHWRKKGVRMRMIQKSSQISL